MSILASRTTQVRIALVTVLVLVGLLVPISSGYVGHLFGPAPVDAVCSSLRIYEDSTASGGDSWLNCSDRSNLNNYTNNLLLGCNDAAWPASNTWNDCISKFVWTFTGTTQACLWTDIDYKGAGIHIWPGSAGTDIPGSPFADSISSIEVSDVYCGDPGAQFAGDPEREIVLTLGKPKN